eukprot:618627-Prorocentrum_lima.AAC.1
MCIRDRDQFKKHVTGEEHRCTLKYVSSSINGEANGVVRVVIRRPMELSLIHISEPTRLDVI